MIILAYSADGMSCQKLHWQQTTNIFARYLSCLGDMVFLGILSLDCVAATSGTRGEIVAALFRVDEGVSVVLGKVSVAGGFDTVGESATSVDESLVAAESLEMVEGC
jgi:hypothetical protein